MSEKKYIPEGVWLTCDSGATPSRLTVTNKSSDIYAVPVATEGDKIPGYNIKSFGACKTCPSRVCTMPVPIMWLKPQPDVYHGSFRLLKDDSTCMCVFGGPIKIHYSFAAATAHLNWVEAERKVERLEAELVAANEEAERLTAEAERLEALQEQQDKPWYERAGGWLKDKATDGIRTGMNIPGNPLFSPDIPFTDWDNRFKDGMAEGLVNWGAGTIELGYAILTDPGAVKDGLIQTGKDAANWVTTGENWTNLGNNTWDVVSNPIDSTTSAFNYLKDNPESVGSFVGEILPDAVLTVASGGVGGVARRGAVEVGQEAVEKGIKREILQEGGEEILEEGIEESTEKVVREGVEEGLEDAADELPEVVAEDAPVLKGRRPATPEHPVRGADGNLTEYGKWYYERPSGYRAGVRDDVWDAAKNDNGDVLDPLTKDVMSPDDPWDMGHKPGYEFRKHRESAADRGIGREQFLDEHNQPGHYRPELPSSNRSHADEIMDDTYFGD